METAEQDTPSPDYTSDGLATRIQNLPQELIDWIQSLTLSPVNHQGRLVSGQIDPIAIDTTWRAPSTLQVDSASRRAAASIYYGTNIFQVSCVHLAQFGCRTNQLADCAQWLESLEPAHVARIASIRVRATGDAEVASVHAFVLAASLMPREMFPEGMQDPVYQLDETILAAEAHAQHTRGRVPGLWEVTSGQHSKGWRHLKAKMFTELRFTTGIDRVYSVWLPVEESNFDRIFEALKVEYRRSKALEALI
ncbi:hypothetical protein LTR95_004871 [Oleoguttula sp. CCFEE 5521]